MIDFTYQSGDSFLHRMDPVWKITLLLFAAILVLVTNNIVGLIVSVLLIILSITFSKISPVTVFKPLKRLLWFLIMIFLMNALFYSESGCLYSVWLLCISKEGILQGFNIVLHTFTITVLSSVFIRTTTSVEIMKGMEKIMKPLRIFKIPTKDIALIMSIAIQFIPVFFSDIDRIRKAQTARGADFSGGSIKEKIKSIYPLIIPAFISAFRRADELSLAIEARGFQSEKASLDLP